MNERRPGFSVGLHAAMLSGAHQALLLSLLGTSALCFCGLLWAARRRRQRAALDRAGRAVLAELALASEKSERSKSLGGEFDAMTAEGLSDGLGGGAGGTGGDRWLRLTDFHSGSLVQSSDRALRPDATPASRHQPSFAEVRFVRSCFRRRVLTSSVCSHSSLLRRNVTDTGIQHSYL